MTVQDTQKQPTERLENHESPADEKPPNSAIFQQNQLPLSSVPSPDTIVHPQSTISTVSDNKETSHEDKQQSETPREPSEQLLKAQAEWDAVGTIQPGRFRLGNNDSNFLP